MNRRALNSLYGERVFGPFMSVAMFDLDHFKRTNDIYGHPVGDRVLCRFAAVIKKYDRVGVDAFRLGGEEFALVMSRMTEEGLRSRQQDRRRLRHGSGADAARAVAQQRQRRHWLWQGRRQQPG
ncbi:GGDEF domain-containing protein [Mesorhizobium sp. M0674]|uniref:GGDEF domain-containing protein n=1 Tax=unclassified Mesorhizobium TaxID=325217 RepID=UPI00333C2E78